LNKFCGLGQAGFPRKLLKCRQISGFPLKPPSLCYHKRGLIAT